MTEGKQSVYIVEDDPVAAAFALAAARAAGLEARQFPSAESMLATVTRVDRGCVVLDLQLAGMHGLELQSALQDRGICMPVIIVSGHGDVPSAVRAMKQHAFDYFEKPVPIEQLTDSICRAVAEDTRRATERADADTIRRRYVTLSPRERQVMTAVVEGLANKQIAARFELSEKTIEVHRGNVMRKMQVDSVAALVRASLVCEPT